MNEMVSIIIPNFNRAGLIIHTLESIRLQTYSNFECLIIDDHSTDNSLMVISDYIKKDDRFKLFKRPSNKIKGANSCRNYGYELSKGNYINWFDSDDIMLENHLISLIKVIEIEGFDFAIGDSRNFNEIDGLLDKPYVFDRENEKISANNFGRQTIGWITDDFLAKKEILDNVKFNEKFKTDGDEYNFFSQLLHQNSKGVFVNKVLTYRRLHEKSLSHKTRLTNQKYFFNVASIKFYTANDIEKYGNENLICWFLAGYMQYAFKISLKGGNPPFFIKSLPKILRYFGINQALNFLLAITLSKYSGKGYVFLRKAIQY